MLKVAFEFEPLFDQTVESHARLSFRVNRSLCVERVEWPVPRIAPGKSAKGHVLIPFHSFSAAADVKSAGKTRTTTTEKKTEKKANNKKETPIDTYFFADLFAQTNSTLDKLELPCRHFLATAIWTYATMQNKTGTVAGHDLVKGHEKFRLRFLGVELIKGGKHAFVNDAKAHRRLLERMYALALSANKTYRKGAWLHPALAIYNTSYIDALYAPPLHVPVPNQFGACYPVPGWVDLRHLTKESMHPLQPKWFDHMFLQACHRMQVSPDVVLSNLHDSATKGPSKPSMLALEVLCDAASWIAHRTVYLHDTVDVTPIDTNPRSCRSIEGVDHYGFPRLMDAICEAGDDCESLTKETLLFLHELERLFSTAPNKLSKLSQALAQLARRYTWYQVTGAIDQGNPSAAKLMDETELAEKECHSWLLGVPNETNKLWIQRGRNHVAKLKGCGGPHASTDEAAEDAEWPIVFVEGTEYTTSAPFRYDTKVEQSKTQFAKQFQKCPVAEAFRYKVPWSLVQRFHRYHYLITAVTTQNWPEQACLEFVFGYVTTPGQESVSVNRPENKQGKSGKTVKGALVSHVMSAEARQPGHGLALFPVHCLHQEDLDDADAVLEWFPPLVPMHLPSSSLLLSEKPIEKNAHLLFVRTQDWEPHKQAFADWCKANHYTYTTREHVTASDCLGLEISVRLAD